MMKNLIKIVLIMSLFVVPASCEVVKPLIIEDLQTLVLLM